MILVTSESSKSSHSKNQNRINYPRGHFKCNLKGEQHAKTRVHSDYNIPRDSNQIKSNLLEAEGPSWSLTLP